MGESKPNGAAKLPVERLYRPADLSGLGFATIEELEPQADLLGQERASEARRFAAAIRERGFNPSAIGAREAPVREAVGGSVRHLAQGAAPRAPVLVVGDGPEEKEGPGEKTDTD
ncbi:MAG TPA: hypothetical protein VMA37_16300 [Acetobacteraceae bacterium]|nr:hypothetical protein [Acetobacteraceae bacterium]